MGTGNEHSEHRKSNVQTFRSVSLCLPRPSRLSNTASNASQTFKRAYCLSKLYALVCTMGCHPVLESIGCYSDPPALPRLCVSLCYVPYVSNPPSSPPSG